MTGHEPERARVRLRWARGTFITDAMEPDGAAALRDSLLEQVLALGDGYRFVGFPGHEGREVHVRARDVVAVELLPELPDRRPPAEVTGQRPAATTAAVGGAVHGVTFGYPSHGVVPVEAGGAHDGTDFLRRLAHQQDSVGPRPARRQP